MKNHAPPDHLIHYFPTAYKNDLEPPQSRSVRRSRDRTRDATEIGPTPSNRVDTHDGRPEGVPMSEEETKTLTEALLAIASNKSKPIDSDIANALKCEGKATIVATSITCTKNVAMAKSMNPTDRLAVTEELAKIGELDRVESKEDKKENPDEAEDVTEEALSSADSDSCSPNPALPADNGQTKIRIWTKRLRTYGHGVSIICSMFNRPSSTYRHWAVEYRGVFLDLHKDHDDGSISLRVVDDDMKKAFDKAKTIGSSNKETIAFRRMASRVMKSRQKKKYHYQKNNCQHFAKIAGGSFLIGEYTEDAKDFKVSMRNFTSRAIDSIRSME